MKAVPISLQHSSRTKRWFIICLIALIAFFIVVSVAYLTVQTRRCIASHCLTPITNQNENDEFKNASELIHMGDYEAAEAILLRIVAYDPHNFDALVKLGGQLRHRGHYAEAEPYFLRAIAEKPNDPFIYVDAGKLYRNKHDRDKAIAMFTKAESLNPNQARLWSYGYAELYITTGEFDKAEAADNRALSIDPHDAYAYMSLGNVYRREKKYDAAVENYRTSLKLSSTSEAAFGMGYAFLEQDKLDEAENAFRTYISNFPAPRGEVYFGLGQIAMKRHQLFEAVWDFEFAHYLDVNFSLGPVRQLQHQAYELSWLRGIELQLYSLFLRYGAFYF